AGHSPKELATESTEIRSSMEPRFSPIKKPEQSSGFFNLTWSGTKA
ncbi:MAG: hypothetical protein ACI843_002268, partial [Psychrobacter glaciei]